MLDDAERKTVELGKQIYDLELQMAELKSAMRGFHAESKWLKKKKIHVRHDGTQPHLTTCIHHWVQTEHAHSVKEALAGDIYLYKTVVREVFTSLAAAVPLPDRSRERPKKSHFWAKSKGSI